MGQRILIVEDEEASLFGMVEYFATLGFEVDAASDHAEARSRLAGSSYSLLITDVRLGGTRNEDGLDLAIVAAEATPPIAVIVLTAFRSERVNQEASRRAPSFLVLDKPQRLPDVAAAARELLSRSAVAAPSRAFEPS
jgi:DNA-binding response OmpR family regulator